MTTTVLIADGEPVLREGLAELLGSQCDFVVVGEVSNAVDAIEQARAQRPDLAVIALDLPGGGALATASRIRRISPVTRLVVMVPACRQMAPGVQADALVSYGNRADQVLSRIRAVGPYGPALRSTASRPSRAYQEPSYWRRARFTPPAGNGTSPKGADR